MNDLKMKQMNKDTIDSQHSPIQTIMQSSQEEAPSPSEKRYARLSERIGHNESCEAQRASNGIYQCVGMQQGIWLLKTMATHPLTMISCIKLL